MPSTVNTAPPPVSPVAQTIARVCVVKSIQEEGRTYRPDDQFDTSPERAQTLQGLGLVRVLDPHAPPPGPKLQAARQRWTEVEHDLSVRRRELVAIGADVHQAEERVVALRAGLNATDGLAAARAAQDMLAEGERNLEAKRQLQENQRRRVRELASREQDASKVVRQIAARIEDLKKAIPAQAERVAGLRHNHEKKLNEAEAVLHSVRPAEAELQKFQAELKALEG